MQPEQSDSWELGVQQGFGPLTLDLTYFDAALENEIFTDFIFTPGTNGGFGTFFATPKNRSGESERRGVELAGTLTLSDSLSLSGAWTSLDSQNESGVDEIRVPENTVSFGLGWRSLTRDGLKAGLALDYVGEQKDTDFGSFQTVTLDPYTLASATLDYPLNPHLTLTLRGENLLDETVTDVFGYRNTGRGLFIGLKVR